MKRIAIIAGLFGVLVMSSAFATPVSAEPMITFSLGKPEGMLVQPVKDLNAMILCNSNVGNCSTIILENQTGLVITDFHIIVIPAQSMAITGEGESVFEDTVGSTTTIDFAVGKNSSGIPVGMPVTITTIGFSANTIFIGNATAVPEPTTIFLLGTGLAGVAIKTRKRFRGPQEWAIKLLAVSKKPKGR